MNARWFPMWIFPLLITLAAGTVWLRLSIIKTSYTISQSDKKLKQAQERKDSLELQANRLRSPKRLETLAKNYFVMGQPQLEQVVHLK